MCGDNEELMLKSRSLTGCFGLLAFPEPGFGRYHLPEFVRLTRWIGMQEEEAQM
jgi:hypothetical protein